MAKKNPSEKAQEKGKREGKKKLPSSTSRVKPNDVDDDNPVGASKLARNIKGIIRTSLKPSYSLQRGTGYPNPHPGGESLRSMHRRRLRLLLKKLIGKGNWVEASGVLSVLLQASPSETSTSRIRRKYWAALEVMHHVKGDNISKRKLQLVYDLMIKKLGRKKSRPTKERFAAQCEFIIFCLTRGDIEDAHQAALCLMQEPGFESDSVSNFLVGLTYFQRWYLGIPREMKLEDISQSAAPMKPVMSEGGIHSEEWMNSVTAFQSQMSEGLIGMSIDGHNAVETQGTKFPLNCTSSTSVGNGKDNSRIIGDPIRKLPMEVDDNLHKETLKKEDLSMDSAERQGREDLHDDEIPSTSIFYTPGLPPWLLPLQLPRSTENLEDFIYMQRGSLNDNYRNGLKYLRAALYLEPSAHEAFHPLIQMLLAGDKVEEALNEAEKFNPCTVFQLRLKTSLLEHFNNSNNPKIFAQVEDSLRRNPTCSHSMAKLIDMHLNGHCSTEKVVELIGLHLDGTFAQCGMWEVFASCLLNLAHGEGDRLSGCSEGDQNRERRKYTYDINQIPDMFCGSESQSSWQLRCKWWQKRHYSRKMLESEIVEGDLRLVTYKAAAACHLYGREFGYVVKAAEHLEGEKRMDLLPTLRIHMQNSVGFYCNLGETSMR
ncbi:OLC1v1023159C1 [Oldenlandia corymbosa var. corymbosa]|uniref:OLC1v1023159C1 n=1 Tax=Oldenlandia corymbosa var. corymbosa TaxID=529605 RepID=A0AAV1C298_OLDCO|nr:OLC1v1023159C1 [Oldenlandia corymbosa var. corymbosa]